MGRNTGDRAGCPQGPECAALSRAGRHPAHVDLFRAAPLVRVTVKITVKNATCEESSATEYGVFDCDFDFDSQEWGGSEFSPLSGIV